MERNLRRSCPIGQLSAAECSKNIDSTIENQQKSPIDIRKGYSRRFVLMSRYSRPLAQQQARQDDDSSQIKQKKIHSSKRNKDLVGSLTNTSLQRWC